MEPTEKDTTAALDMVYAFVAAQAVGTPDPVGDATDRIARALAAAREEGGIKAMTETFIAYEKYGGWTSLTSRADAWLAVCDAMDAAVPDWAIGGTGTGVEKMVDAIKALAAEAARKAPQ